MRTTFAYQLAFLSLGACASAGVSYGPPRPFGRDPLYAHEMRSTALLTAYDAVERLRPFYLHQRGPSTLLGASDTRVRVFLNDVPIGGVEVLRTIPVSSVAWIRYMSPREATVRFGAQGGGGAIVVWVGH